jgi:hypothetical protein
MILWWGQSGYAIRTSLDVRQAETTHIRPRFTGKGLISGILEVLKETDNMNYLDVMGSFNGETMVVASSRLCCGRCKRNRREKITGECPHLKRVSLFFVGS